MTVGHEAVPQIRSGPRWEAVLAAIDVAEDALDETLTEDEQADGWSESLRTAILADVRRVRDELSAVVHPRVALEDWSAIDSIGAGDAPRVDAILDVDLVLGDLERAERALLEARGLLGDLAAPLMQADEESGLDAPVRAELRAILEELCQALGAGQYLSAQEMDPWSDALRAVGFLRAPHVPGLRDDAAARGFTRQRIVQFPPGRRWEQVAIFDGWLCNVAWTDVLDDEEDGDAS